MYLLSAVVGNGPATSIAILWNGALRIYCFILPFSRVIGPLVVAQVARLRYHFLHPLDSVRKSYSLPATNYLIPPAQSFLFYFVELEKLMQSEEMHKIRIESKI